jgi:hypothetical protein
VEFDYRERKTDDIDYPESQMEKAKERNGKENLKRPEEARRFIEKEGKNEDNKFSFLGDKEIIRRKKEEYRKWRRKKREEKKNRIEKKLEGNGISVKIDKMGRVLYYRKRGKWISHDKVKEIINETN